jgi:anti-sigma-K factor RskA
MTHQQLIDSAASYALDALDGDERAAFESHLAGCAKCQAEVAAYREVAGALAYAAPTAGVSPPPALRDRILRDAHQVRPIAAARAAVSTPPAPLAVSPKPAPPARVPRRSIAPWLVAAASLAAAVGFAFVYRGARAESAELRSEVAEARATIARERSTLAAFVGPEVHVVSLTARADQKPGIRVFWNHTQHTFVVTALGLPAAPTGKTYQLWAIRKGRPPMSMGTFDAGPNGRTMTALAVAQDITNGGLFDDCALTVEPIGGSPQPTETPRMTGSWRHVD